MNWQTKIDLLYIAEYNSISIIRERPPYVIINNLALRVFNDITCWRIYKDNIISINSNSYRDLTNKPLYFILFKSFQKRKIKVPY